MKTKGYVLVKPDTIIKKITKNDRERLFVEIPKDFKEKNKVKIGTSVLIKIIKDEPKEAD